VAEGRGERLAVELEVATRRLVELLEGLSREQWRLGGANAPGWDYGEDELRTIGQIALHTAHQHLVQMEIAKGAAEGRIAQLAGPSNQQEAAANPDPDPKQVIRLLDTNCATAASMLRGLSDEQLDHALTFRGWTMTALELAEQAQIGHVLWHTASIKAALDAVKGCG